MYNKQEMIKRIKKLLKEKGITQSRMLSDCGMGKNALMRLMDSDGDKDILLGSFVKIADYLGCSADYLLGRDADISGAFRAEDFDDAVQEQQLEIFGMGAAAESTKRIVPKRPDDDTIIEISRDDF